MKTPSIKISFLLLMMPVYFCCKKIINVNLTNAAPQIVIQGNVTNAQGPYSVQISQTVNFNTDNVFPPVSGAFVSITDVTTGQTDTLTEAPAGTYTTDILPQGTPGHTYQLKVLASGQTYTASSTMPQPVLLDSVSFQHLANFSKIQINATANFQDPVGVANYYTFQEFINRKQLNQTFVFDDRLSDGKYISANLFTDSSYINVGDTVALNMNCVDKNVYNYFNTLQAASGATDFQSTSPSNPISNISNGALGYFSANTITSKVAVAK